MIQEIINRFKELSVYNPNKGIISESFNNVDTSKYVCIGEVPYDPWLCGIDKLFVMVSPEKTMKWGQSIYDIRYTENQDGSGRQTDEIPSNVKRKVKIYPQYEDTEFGEMFLGKKKDENTIKQEHQEFVSKLFKTGNEVIIHHNSSNIIKDGVVKKGAANSWSNNTDMGIYFWGSRNSGKDPSNNSLYTYYCVIPLSDIYDLATNSNRLSKDLAMEKFKYVGDYWPNDRNVITIQTYQSTPIWCILDKQNGKWYDKDWKEIEKPF